MARSGPPAMKTGWRGDMVLSRAQAMQITETKAVVSEVAICSFREVLLEADCQSYNKTQGEWKIIT